MTCISAGSIEQQPSALGVRGQQQSRAKLLTLLPRRWCCALNARKSLDQGRSYSGKLRRHENHSGVRLVSRKQRTLSGLISEWHGLLESIHDYLHCAVGNRLVLQFYLEPFHKCDAKPPNYWCRWKDFRDNGYREPDLEIGFWMFPIMVCTCAPRWEGCQRTKRLDAGSSANGARSYQHGATPHVPGAIHPKAQIFRGEPPLLHPKWRRGLGRGGALL